MIYANSTDDGKSWSLSWVDKQAYNSSSSGMPGFCLDGNKLFFSYHLEKNDQPLIAWKHINCFGNADPLHR